jgi:hypothetical protein
LRVVLVRTPVVWDLGAAVNGKKNACFTGSVEPIKVDNRDTPPTGGGDAFGGPLGVTADEIRGRELV